LTVFKHSVGPSLLCLASEQKTAKLKYSEFSINQNHEFKMQWNCSYVSTEHSLRMTVSMKSVYHVCEMCSCNLCMYLCYTATASRVCKYA